MFDFLKENNMSKVRTWAKAQKKASQKEKPIKIISNSIIYGLSTFCSSERDGKEKENFINKARKKVINKYSGDTSLFEIGCYLYFRIDLWHYRNKMQKYRERLVNYLINQFLLVFRNSLCLENIEEILQNRLDLYGRLVREIKNSEKLQNEIDFYLTQLTILTANNTPPKIYNFIEDFPVIILDAFEETFLKTEIRSFEQIMIPICLKNIVYFYKLTSDNNK